MTFKKDSSCLGWLHKPYVAFLVLDLISSLPISLSL